MEVVLVNVEQLFDSEGHSSFLKHRGLSRNIQQNKTS